MATATAELSPFIQRTYLAESLDPVHVGTGEFQLGRVDNTIVREPGTNLPKIPGSSISGVSRAYSAMALQRYRREDGKSCAGKGGAKGEDHCGHETCRVCTTYGFSIDTRSFQGLAQFSDARVLFFPVYSAAGPLWVTCASSLWAAGCETGTLPELGDRLLPLGRELPNPINLGWLYLEHYSGAGVGPAREWTVDVGGRRKKLEEVSFLRAPLSRLVLVSEERFSNIVEDQLEVRTSVSISPETGAAEEGALFTAEAIPRACFLFFHVTYLRPEYFLVPRGNGGGKRVEYEGRHGTVEDIESNVVAGLRLMEYLGVGGVNTRGMGRLRVIE